MFGSRKEKPEFEIRPSDAAVPSSPQATESAADAADPDQTADLIDALSSERDALRAERDDALNKYKLALADFQNFQRRSMSNEAEAKRQGLIGVVNSILPVIDHFDLALAQAGSADPAACAQAAFVEGVRSIRAELLRALELHGVQIIHPKPNDAFEPARHMAVLNRAAEGVEPGHISLTLQPGYALGERIIRSASVAVAPAAG